MTSTLHLTEDELRDATGYIHRTKQMEVLCRWRMPFYVAGTGRLKVLREHYINRHSPAKAANDDDGFNPDAI